MGCADWRTPKYIDKLQNSKSPHFSVYVGKV